LPHQRGFGGARPTGLTPSAGRIYGDKLRTDLQTPLDEDRWICVRYLLVVCATN
jgi:hypothetical protein